MDETTTTETQPDWILTSIRRSTRDVHYPWSIQGINLSARGERFSWHVPSLTDDRYVLAENVDAETAALFAEAKRLSSEVA